MSIAFTKSGNGTSTSYSEGRPGPGIATSLSFTASFTEGLLNDLPIAVYFKLLSLCTAELQWFRVCSLVLVTMLSFSLKSPFLLEKGFNTATHSTVLHLRAYLPTPAQCLMNY